MAEVLPVLYLHGLSSSDFGPALTQFLGPSHGLSAELVLPRGETWPTVSSRPRLTRRLPAWRAARASISMARASCSVRP